MDHPQYLLRLAELELIDRHQRMVERRIRAARFPAVKSLDTFDFTAIPSVNKSLVMELARCEYIQRRENIIAVGNSGTGKTHMALGLGLAACQRGMSVGFTTAAALVHELMEASDERRLLNLQRQLSRLNLLIIDELGFVPDRHSVQEPTGADSPVLPQSSWTTDGLRLRRRPRVEPALRAGDRLHHAQTRGTTNVVLKDFPSSASTLASESWRNTLKLPTARWRTGRVPG